MPTLTQLLSIAAALFIIALFRAAIAAARPHSAVKFGGYAPDGTLCVNVDDTAAPMGQTTRLYAPYTGDTAAADTLPAARIA